MPVKRVSSTIQRVVFEGGHCLLKKQETRQMYIDMLDEDVRKLAGAILDVHDVYVETLSEDDTTTSVHMENMCGTLRSYHEEVAFAGALIRPGAIRVGIVNENALFVGTHRLFNTLYGRCTYHDKVNMWHFKGCRSLEGVVGVIRDLVEDRESPLFPRVTMLSATLRTGASLVIDPSRALFNQLITHVYSKIVRLLFRTDDTNNLYFMEVVSWHEMMRLVVENGGTDKDVLCVNAYLSANKSEPKASVGYTRRGVFFIRVAFTDGCLCAVDGSHGIDHSRVPEDVSEGGVAPFVNVMTRFILILLVKMRAVGSDA